MERSRDDDFESGRLSYSVPPPSGVQDARVRDAYTFARCINVTKNQIVEASRSHDECKALLEHLSSISRPMDGGPLVLLLFGRLGTVAGAWLDGELRIELAADGEGTTFDMVNTLGFGMAERVFPRFRFAVPLGEFEGAMARVPEIIWPLTLEKREGSVTLSATRRVRMSTMPPPGVEQIAPLG
jgi:hypothetical protein